MRYLVPVLLLVAAIGLLIGGIASGQPGLLLGYICLSPLLFIGVGFTLKGVLSGRRPVMVDEREFQALQQHRTRGGRDPRTSQSTG